MTIKNNLYNIFGGAGRAILFLLTIPLMVNYMGIEKFGIWALITSIGNIALMLDVGIASTTMHFVSEINTIKSKTERVVKQERTIPVLFLINILFSSIIAVSFLFFNEEIASIFLKKNLISQDIVSSLRWIGLYSSVMLLQHLFSGIIQAFNRFLLVNVIKFINILTINLGLLIFSFYNATFVTLTFYMFLISLITLLVYIFLASKYLNIFVIKPKLNKKASLQIINYSITTWVGYFGSVIFTQFDKIIIGKFSSPEILGIYAAIISITSYISSIATVGLQPIIPKLTEFWTKFKTNKTEFQEEYRHAIQFNTLLIFLASSGVFVFLKILLTNVMDIDIEAYPEAVLAFQLAIFVYALNSLSIPGFYTLMSIKQTKFIAIWQILGAFTALFLIYILGINYGLYGIIIGNFGLIITLNFNFITSKKTFNNRFKWFSLIYIPLIIFLIATIIIISIDSFVSEFLIFILSSILLSFWYLKENPSTYALILGVLKKKR